MTSATASAQHRLSAGDRRTVEFQGLTTRYLVAAEQTGGAFAVLEHELVPFGLGAPVHTHEREDEISYVVSGRLGVEINGAVHEAAAGDTVFKPRGIPHAFWNPGIEPLRFVELITPAGFEGYFADVEPILGVAGPPDLAALGAVMARYALSVDPESVGRLMGEHGLGCRA